MYGFATEIADTFCNYLDKMGEERVEELRQFLTETRLTINFEFESPHHQHIVPLYDSKLVLIGCSGQSLYLLSLIFLLDDLCLSGALPMM